MSDNVEAGVPGLTPVEAYRLGEYLIVRFEDTYAVYQVQGRQERKLRWHTSRSSRDEAVEWISQQPEPSA